MTDYYNSDNAAVTNTINSSICFFSVHGFFSSENTCLWSTSIRMKRDEQVYQKKSIQIKTVRLFDSVLPADAIHKCNNQCRVQDGIFIHSSTVIRNSKNAFCEFVDIQGVFPPQFG